MPLMMPLCCHAAAFSMPICHQHATFFFIAIMPYMPLLADAYAAV